MLEKRMDVRPRHLEGMAKLGEHIVLAGGLLDDEGKMKGSVLILDVEDHAALEDYLKKRTIMWQSTYGRRLRLRP